MEQHPCGDQHRRAGRRQACPRGEAALPYRRRGLSDSGCGEALRQAADGRLRPPLRSQRPDAPFVRGERRVRRPVLRQSFVHPPHGQSRRLVLRQVPLRRRTCHRYRRACHRPVLVSDGPSQGEVGQRQRIQASGNRANIKHLSRYQAADYNAELNDVEDMANALIRFENGASLLVDVSFSLHTVKDEGIVKLFGTKGGFEIDPEVVMVTEKNDIILNTYPQTDSKGMQMNRAFQSEIDHFVDCAANGKQPISPVEDGVEIMKILGAIYESAAQGREVTFP
ncbi:hypothetical protein BN871_BF_00480 [Paenibacillus sp. P22]|nr:hypothetical protein BN871_BF_00480 [Paenibacillus sp. P22]